jgi:hypothetical protein
MLDWEPADHSIPLEWQNHRILLFENDLSVLEGLS